MKSGRYCRLTKKKKPYENFKRREKYTKIMNLHALITQLQGHEFMANLISSLYTRSPDSWVFWSNPRITSFHLEIFWYLSLKHEDSFFEPLSHTINFPWFILSLLPSSPLSLPSSSLSPSPNWSGFFCLFVSNEITHNERALIPQGKGNECCIGQKKSYLPQIFFTNCVFSF